MDNKPARKVQFGSDAPKTSNISLWLALGLGSLALIANYTYLKKDSLTAFKVKPGITILAGSHVARDQFEEVEISGPIQEMKRLLVDKSDFEAFSSIALADTLRPGELLMQSSFSTAGARKLSDQIDQGFRAIALPINRTSAEIAKNTRVGNFIDVYDCMGLQKPITTPLDSANTGLSNPFLQRVRVVAVGSAYDVPAANSEINSLTVLVPDDQINVILPRVQVNVCILLLPTNGN